jgi:hypothetical protein
MLYRLCQPHETPRSFISHGVSSADIDPETAGVDLPVLPDVDEDFDSHIKPTRCAIPWTLRIPPHSADARRDGTAHTHPNAAHFSCRAAKEKPLRLRGDIELHDQAYKGRKSTRAAVFDASDSDGDASGSDEDGDSGDEDDEDELDDGLEALGRSGQGRAGVNGFGSDEDESGSSGEDDEDEESGEERRASGASASTRAGALARASSKLKGEGRKQKSLDRRRKPKRGGDEAEGDGGSSLEERGKLSGEDDAGAGGWECCEAARGSKCCTGDCGTAGGPPGPIVLTKCTAQDIQMMVRICCTAHGCSALQYW